MGSRGLPGRPRAQIRCKRPERSISAGELRGNVGVADTCQAALGYLGLPEPLECGSLNARGFPHGYTADRRRTGGARAAKRTEPGRAAQQRFPTRAEEVPGEASEEGS